MRRTGPWLLLLFALLPRPARAERLPIRVYSTGDGLAAAFVNRIVHDSHGFLWFCTRNGLSRFDGDRFVTYTTEQGLPRATINGLLEARDGAYWVATNGGGVARLDPNRNAGSTGGAESAPAPFVLYPVGSTTRTNRVNALVEDRSGRIWAGTDGGVFRLDNPRHGRFGGVEVGVPAGDPEALAVAAIVEDRTGAIWIGFSHSGLVRLDPAHHVQRYTTHDGLPSNGIWCVLADRDGRMWIGTPHGLCRLEWGAGPSPITRIYTLADGLADNKVNALVQSADGTLWIGTDRGLTEFDGNRMRSYTTAQGLADGTINCVAEDANGNLWMGTGESGAMKLARSGFTAYTTADSRGLTEIRSIAEGRGGELYFFGRNWFITSFDGVHFRSIRPAHTDQMDDRWLSQPAFFDRSGQWWVLTDDALLRFAPVERFELLARAGPRAIYTSRNGLRGRGAYRIFEDSRGDLWIGADSGEHGRLTRWERATEAFHSYSEADGLPAADSPFSFTEDGAGDIWIGFYDGGLARFRAGRFTTFSSSDGWPAGMITSLFVDHARRLWISSNTSGLYRVDDPTAAHPTPTPYSTADGLTTSDVRCVTEDGWGRLYVGTARGVDRLDPLGNHVRHYTIADGLNNEFVTAALRDRRGWLWFGTMKGVSRLIPGPDRRDLPPAVRITGVRVAGVPLNLSALGEAAVPDLELQPDQNQIQIDFTAPAFAPGERLRFEYKLEGADRAWNAPTEHRTVNYARLTHGSYRFLVRALDADRRAGTAPAMVAFTIVPPLWQRWWFMAGAAGMVGLAAYALYRYRLSQVVELERVRTRIASDLHDDIGSSLSQIAVLSEVLNKRTRTDDPAVSTALAQVARVSREAVDSMGDIVWAVNPQRDRLHDLVIRMRRFASELLPARGIQLAFLAPGTDQDLGLGADTRREVFLIFKEALNNAVRHAACTRAEIAVAVAASSLILTVQDNGQGFDATAVEHGHGLANMRRRAEALGGSLHVASGAGRGTLLTLTVPIGSRPPSRAGGRWPKAPARPT